jgi:hypothetical protein
VGSENAQLVFGGEPPPFSLWHDFRVWRIGEVSRVLAIAIGLNARFV